MPRPLVEGEARSVPLTTVVTPTTKNRLEKFCQAERDYASTLLRDLLLDFLDEYEGAHREQA